VQPASWAPLTAFAASLSIVWWLATGRFSTAVVDRPKARSLHETAIPRTGGLGLHGGALLALSIIAPDLSAALWLALAIMLLVSFIDDLRDVAPAWRLAAHVSACGLFVAGALGGQEPTTIAAVAILCAWMANLYNFMDGSDGLAGGMAVAGFSFYGAAAWISGNPDFALANFSIAAAAAGFLVFNFHPARIFLGDVGSVPLGFLAAAFGVLGCLKGLWAWWYPALVFSPFVVDASVTLARRAMRMERIWQAHRDHYYQRLVRMGWGHRKTALAEYGLMVASGATALAGLQLPTRLQWVMLAVAALVYLAIVVLVEIRWRNFQRQGRS
jgi:UDP-N-acetylmuramyl pentapeptide phosphotransferase/UDP-N-acetylglucosamine-1-phosphate transferase